MKQLRNTVGKEENVLTPAESTIRRLCVFQTVLSNMVELLKASDQYEPLADENLAKAKEYIISQFGNKRGVVRDFSFMNDNIKDMLIALWNDEGIRATWELYRSKIQVQESLEYFMNEAERVLKEDSEITKLDWLHVRIRTTGMVVENFKVKEASFTAIEVGGARVERKKWIHVFQNVTAVVYVCAISEYDEFLFEDRSMNRMVESLNLFEEMVNHEDLSKSGMILYMNKADIFKRKIAHIPIKHVDLNDPFENRWEDYNGPNAVGYDPDSPEFFEAYEASTQYFIDKFCALKKNSTKGKAILIKSWLKYYV